MKQKYVIVVGPGKGGLGKTACLLYAIPFFNRHKIKYHLLDYDWENTDKSGLQNFDSRATKLNIHSPRAMDEFLDAVDQGIDVLLVDLPAGSGEPVFKWFDELYDEASALGLVFTLMAVTTNEAGSVQSTLKWASHLQDRVRYVVVQNELTEADSQFEYLNDEPQFQEFKKLFSAGVITMKKRPLDLESEMRNHTATLDQVANGKVKDQFLLKTRNRIRAKIAQNQYLAELETVSEFLIPPSK
ncbi:hypothetical protein N9891_00055 [bacterium]|nr:hypothetical protein [bacterium]